MWPVLFIIGTCTKDSLLCFGVPDRREHFDHQIGVNVRHRQGTDGRRRIGFFGRSVADVTGQQKGRFSYENAEMKKPAEAGF